MTTPFKQTKVLVLSLALAFPGAGCFTVNASLPGALRGDVKPEQTETVGTVDIKKTNTFMLWGLLSAPPPDFFEKELKEQVSGKNGDGVANLTYESEFSPQNMLLGCVTCGIIAPRDFRLSGNIVRIKKGAGVGGAAPTRSNDGLPPPPPMNQGYGY